MADFTEASPLSSAKKRQRAENWSPEEKALLVELVHENFAVLINKKTDVEANIKKKKLWESIALSVTALGTSTRNWEQARDKWQKMCTSGKAYVSKKKKAANQTGGGAVEVDMTENPLLEKVGSLHKGNPSWYGIRGGSETGPTPSNTKGKTPTLSLISEAATPPAPFPHPQAASASAKPGLADVIDVGNHLDNLLKKCEELQTGIAKPVPSDDINVSFLEPSTKADMTIKEKKEMATYIEGRGAKHRKSKKSKSKNREDHSDNVNSVCKCYCPVQHAFLEQELKNSKLKELLMSAQLEKIRRELDKEE